MTLLCLFFSILFEFNFLVYHSLFETEAHASNRLYIFEHRESNSFIIASSMPENEQTK